MKAFASVQGFEAALFEVAEPDVPESETAAHVPDEEGDRQIAAKKRNSLAVANLTMAFQTDALMGLVYKAIDEDFPAGQAWKIVAALKRQYMPYNRISRVELRKSIANVSMSKEDDPSMYSNKSCHSKTSSTFMKARTMEALLDGCNVQAIDSKMATQFEHLLQQVPRFVDHLRIFGEAGTVTLKRRGTPKIADRGTHCMYEMWSPMRGRFHETRDVIWLKQKF